MSTRGLLVALAFGLAIAGSGTAQALSPAVELRDGGRVRVVSAYLRTGELAVVRGMVVRAPLWRGPVSGHLHVAAFGAQGDVLSRRTVKWQGRMSGSHPAAAIYQSDLAVPAAEVARIEVAYAPDRHPPVEGFQ